ncbi:MAG: N-acetylglucosamine-6-phosphate deacetylase [Firmicutes bacterium ADurb.Bin182]|nr:MAG: N-acetylglucosamine-6-phosphate deacetylase [Firmicutes bacterium ADurb.Bin182]
MKFKNARVYGKEFKFVRGGFEVKNGRFANVLSCSGDDAIDLEGAYVIPGLVDIHNHGNSGYDFSDGNPAGLETMAAYLAQNGVTSFTPASMTLPEQVLEKAYRTAARFSREMHRGLSVLRGIHMEGPFFSAAKKGAQNGAYLKNPDFDMFERLNEAAEGLIKIADVAPELPGALEYIEKVSKRCVVSVAHTDAGYEEAAAAIRAGAGHITHLFNAMLPLLHRAPGVIGAAAEADSVSAELISDGVHVHESAVRAAYKLFGPERLCLISDALSCCGMPGGKHMLGGQKIRLDGTIARLEDGTIAGSANNLFGIMRLAISFGIPREDAVRMASFNPARVIGADKEIGTVENGKSADFLVLDDAFNLKKVYINGFLVERP